MLRSCTTIHNTYLTCTGGREGDVMPRMHTHTHIEEWKGVHVHVVKEGTYVWGDQRLGRIRHRQAGLEGESYAHTRRGT